MSLKTLENPVIPSEDDVRLAKNSHSKLKSFRNRKLTIFINNTEEKLELSPTLVRVLIELFSEISKGNAVELISVHSELTTQKAAEFLGVSRPFLIKQLENQVIPFRKVGKHRRILFSDLKNYKNGMIQIRLDTLTELTKQAQEMDMGY